MLPKVNRLPRSVVFTNAQSFTTPFFRVLFQENEVDYNRFGFVVSKSIDKRAVVRNRLKRVLRAICQEFVQTQNHKDILFIVKKNFTEEPTEKIKELISEKFKAIL